MMDHPTFDFTGATPPRPVRVSTPPDASNGAAPDDDWIADERDGIDAELARICEWTVMTSPRPKSLWSS
jgi:hypothetical protein